MHQATAEYVEIACFGVMNDLERYTVVRERNEHGTVMLRSVPPNRTVFIVECADSDARNALNDATVGSDLRVGLDRVGRRGNAWRATAARPMTAERD